MRPRARPAPAGAGRPASGRSRARARDVACRASQLAHPDVPGTVLDVRNPALLGAVVLAPVGAVALVAVHAAIVEVDGEVTRVGARVLALEVAGVPLIVERQERVVDVVAPRGRRHVGVEAVVLAEAAL